MPGRVVNLTHNHIGRTTELGPDLGQVASLGNRLTLGVDHPHVKPKVLGQLLCLKRLRRNRLTGFGSQFPGNRRQELSHAELDPIGDAAGRIGSRNQLPPDRFGKRAYQAHDLFREHSGDEPTQLVVVDRLQQIDWQRQRQAIVRTPLREPIVDREPLLVDPDRIRKAFGICSRLGSGHEVFALHHQSRFEVRVGLEGVSQGRHVPDPERQSSIVECPHRRFVQHQPAITGPGCLTRDLVQQFGVLPQETEGRIDLVLSECFANEDLPGNPRVDRSVRHPPPPTDRETEQQHAFGRQYALLLSRPERVQILAFDQMSGQRFDPGRIDTGNPTQIPFGGLDQFRGDDPFRASLERAGTGPQIELLLVAAQVFILAVLDRHGRQQARQQRAVDGRIRVAPRFQAELAALDQIEQLAMHVLPLPHPGIREEVSLTLLAELIAGKLGLPGVISVPQFEQTDEV